MRHFPDQLKFTKHQLIAFLAIASFLLTGCHWQNSRRMASLEITRVPASAVGGPLQVDFIEGTAKGSAPGQQVVLYARGNNIWWVQPFRKQPFTRIQPNGTWKNSTHLGTDYAALLVEPGYVPQAKISELPKAGSGVVAVVAMKGTPALSASLKTIHFSGYDWDVRAAASDRGGDANLYDPANAWTDDRGYLHLKMEEHDGRWTCAEIVLNRSLGFGTYRFVVKDTGQLDPFAVVGMLIWDDSASEETRKELDVEVSQWGNPAAKNAQYVVQPYYVPGNIVRFTAPHEELTHIVHWAPGVASFKTASGAPVRTAEKSIADHTFTIGIPSPGAERVHLTFYRFHGSGTAARRPAEVVFEKFDYLP
jgi:hypothetical protein